MMSQLAQWLISVPRKWLALGGIVLTAAANPLFLPLDDDVSESFTVATFRPVNVTLAGNMAAKVTNIREKGLWLSPADREAANQARQSDDQASDEDKTAGGIEWKLVGLIHSENGNEAFVQKGKEPVLSVTNGDLLPSGEEIVALGDDYLVLGAQGIERKILLYPGSF